MNSPHRLVHHDTDSFRKLPFDIAVSQLGVGDGESLRSSPFLTMIGKTELRHMGRGTAITAFKRGGRVLERMLQLVSHFDCYTRAIYDRGLSYEQNGHIKASGLHRHSSFVFIIALTVKLEWQISGA